MRCPSDCFFFLDALETICSDVVFVLSAALMLSCRNAAVNFTHADLSLTDFTAEEELQLVFVHVDRERGCVCCDTPGHVDGSLYFGQNTSNM